MLKRKSKAQQAKRKDVIALTIDGPLLRQIDQRAELLDMNRSQYFRHAARREMVEAGLGHLTNGRR